ncbi:TspO/MBR family protein [Candidatus Methanoperedens nitratireducens]|uniref:Integral membrane protein n=1 Tax=Candidatus Methanoperedens nitratireducens TaxID=1392998 RepID=A0A284VLY9_9EURY|nr:TspO/MBR family protein [Candidatus Methanoperedens nitroreducens]SNQ60274.1 Integral membrane protein [Candidatus Methanoperedens nitroreducens]
MKQSKINNILKLVISVIVCLFAGFIGSVFTFPSIPTWYAALTKPLFNPPYWIFAPVWTILFILMGISLYLVWNKGLQDKKVKISLFIFGVQLVLNVLWSFLFFGLHSPFYAFLEIIILWAAIVLTIVNFFKISRTAGLLLLPYILWVSFAAILNFSIWRLNP